MDIDAMHIGVKQELDKTSALELPSFEDEEIDFWLNNAIRKFVKTRYSGTNIKNKSFEETQKRIDDIRTLIDNAYITSTPGTSFADNGQTFPLPSTSGHEYWFAVEEQVVINVSGTTQRVGVTECTFDEYMQKINDPFSEHLLHYGTAKPLRIFRGSNVELVRGDGYTITGYYLTYLRKPATVQKAAVAVDCDLPEHTHDEIVKMAANMMLENIEQPRYKTHMAEVSTME